jgi:hypothetical protein
VLPLRDLGVLYRPMMINMILPSTQLQRDIIQPLLPFANFLVMPPITQPIAFMTVHLRFHITTLWCPPNHRRCGVVLTWLTLSFSLGQILAICPAWNGIVVPENPSPLEFGNQEFDHIGESPGHESVGLEILSELVGCEEKKRVDLQC